MTVEREREREREREGEGEGEREREILVGGRGSDTSNYYNT